jgi:hypothetical protein
VGQDTGYGKAVCVWQDTYHGTTLVVPKSKNKNNSTLPKACAQQSGAPISRFTLWFCNAPIGKFQWLQRRRSNLLERKPDLIFYPEAIEKF